MRAYCLTEPTVGASEKFPRASRRDASLEGNCGYYAPQMIALKGITQSPSSRLILSSQVASRCHPACFRVLMHGCCARGGDGCLRGVAAGSGGGHGPWLRSKHLGRRASGVFEVKPTFIFVALRSARERSAQRPSAGHSRENKDGGYYDHGRTYLGRPGCQLSEAENQVRQTPASSSASRWGST